MPLYHNHRQSQELNLNLFAKNCTVQDGRNRTYILPAPRFAIRSHAAKRAEVNLNPSVAIWVLAFKRPGYTTIIQ
jgi:hypothetical protein